jgi:diguanylate cyclase (GGDEF)-like protein
MDSAAAASNEVPQGARSAVAPAGHWPEAGADRARADRLAAELDHVRGQLAQLTAAGTRDAASGLDNRATFSAALDHMVGAAQLAGSTVAVMLIGIERLASLRESLGYAAADAVVRRIADRLGDAAPAAARLARAGENSFALAWSAHGALRAGAVDPACLADRLIAAIAGPIRVGEDDLRLLACAGIARFPEDGLHADRLLANAQAALRFAREHGHRACEFFTPAIGARAARRLGLEAELHRGLDRGEFLVHYQPRCMLPEGRIVGVEALLRWDHPERGMLAAADFIDVAVETGLITPIGEAVLRQACKDAMQWPAHVALSVNLSTREFRGTRLEEIIDHALVDSGLQPGRFHLELTEAALRTGGGDHPDETDVSLVRLIALRERGLRMVLDNFGMAASGPDLLRRCRAEFVKIDARLIRGIEADSGMQAVVASIAALARHFGATVIAEGIEDASQAAAAVRAGCSEGQGYYLGRPVPADALRRLLNASAAQTGMRGVEA